MALPLGVLASRRRMVPFSQNVRSGLAVRTVVDSSGPNGITPAAYGVHWVCPNRSQSFQFVQITPVATIREDPCGQIMVMVFGASVMASDVMKVIKYSQNQLSPVRRLGYRLFATIVAELGSPIPNLQYFRSRTGECSASSPDPGSPTC